MIIAFFPGAGGNRYLRRLLEKEWTTTDRSYDMEFRDQRFQYRYLNGTLTRKLTSVHVLTHCMNSKKIRQVFPNQPIVFIKSDLHVSLQREWALHGHKRFEEKIKEEIETQSRLEHYIAIKDPLWPKINNLRELAELPDSIQKEVKMDYDKVASTRSQKVSGVLESITMQIIGKINSAYETIRWHEDYYKTYPVDFSAAESVINIDADNLDFCRVMKQELARYNSEIFTEVWNALH